MTKRQRRAKFQNALAIFQEMGKERSRSFQARRPRKIPPASVPRLKVVRRISKAEYKVALGKAL